MAASCSADDGFPDATLGLAGRGAADDCTTLENSEGLGTFA
jgi:hypothetical protein